MKTLLALLLPLLMAGCIVTGKVQPTPTVKRDWSQFIRPPVGTPVMLRAFYVIGPRLSWDSIDFPGTWSDDKPFIVKFSIWKTIDNVVRIEIHYHGEVIGSKNFKPPTILRVDTVTGWAK